MIKKILIKIIILFLFFINFSYSKNKAYIALTIDNQIITNLDIEKETIYLKLFNERLSDLSQEQLFLLAKNSLIREFIKKKELIKYYSLDGGEGSDYFAMSLNQFYQKQKIKNEQELKTKLSKFGLEVSDVKKKIEIESVWNEHIYFRYKDQLDINVEKIKKNLQKKIDEKKEEELISISEIVFTAESKTEKDQKYKVIIQSIIDIGFERSANLYSSADTANNGGKIGWIKKDQLSVLIKEKVNDLIIGETSELINIPGGFLILKLEDKKNEKIEYDFKKALNEEILFARNNKLTQLSLLYYNQIKKKVEISEK